MRAADFFTRKLVENKIVAEDAYDVYCYGINQLIWSLVNLLTVIIIGIVTKNLFFLLGFFVFYIPLRSFAGGIHARTPLRCYISSVIALVIIGVLGHCELNGNVMFVISLICNVVICLLAPVEDENKPLDETERKVYKKRTIIIIIVYSTIALGSRIFELYFLLKVMLYVSVCILAMLLLGYIKNAFRERKGRKNEQNN